MRGRQQLLDARPEWRPEAPDFRREGSDGPFTWLVRPDVVQRDGRAVPGMCCEIRLPRNMREIDPGGFLVTPQDNAGVDFFMQMSRTIDKDVIRLVFPLFNVYGGPPWDGRPEPYLPCAEALCQREITPSLEICEEIVRTQLPPMLALARALYQTESATFVVLQAARPRGAVEER